MMNCFPTLYRDELFYSLVARYKIMCGIISKRAFIKDFYNTKFGQTFMYFPLHFKSIVSNMPPTSKMTENYLIMNHTFYPYLTAFLSSKKSIEIYNIMVEGSKENLLIKSGLCGTKVKFSNYLKYCPQCCREDINRLGETYWRRLHQIPGVLYCKEHKVPLMESKVVTNDNTIDYICADENICKINADEKIEEKSKSYLDINVKYIEAIEYLLNTNVRRKELDFIIGFYIDRLRERKLASSNGSIYMKGFLKEFEDYYSQEYLKLMQSNFEIDDETNWVRLFVRKNNRNRNVLRHLLMLQFLDVDLKDFFECKTVVGKTNKEKIHTPIFSLNQKRNEWLKIISSNPSVPRGELKRIGKGLHTYIYKYDKAWYGEVTPKYIKKKEAGTVVDWNKRDENCLSMVKNAVETLLNKKGKPIRICIGSIRRECGETRYLNNKKLLKTHEYIISVTEDIDSFRIRKIQWAIKEMMDKDIVVTPYQVQLYAGFGGKNINKIRRKIEELISNY
jgi:hypothetical protein